MDIIELPAADSADALWAALGQPVVEDRHEPAGIYRRLAAGLLSVAERGFDAVNFAVTADGIVWSSTGGVWSHRPWTVVADRDLTEIRWIEVGSKSDPQDRTRFVGPALTSILLDTFRAALMVIAARRQTPDGWTYTATGSEWHDIHGGAIDRWVATDGRTIDLLDRPSGRGSIRGELTDAEKAHLVAAGLRIVMEQIDVIVEWKGLNDPDFVEVGWRVSRDASRIMTISLQDLGRWAAVHADQSGQPGWVRISTVQRDGLNNVQPDTAVFVPNDATPKAVLKPYIGTPGIEVRWASGYLQPQIVGLQAGQAYLEIRQRTDGSGGTILPGFDIVGHENDDPDNDGAWANWNVKTVSEAGTIVQAWVQKHRA